MFASPSEPKSDAPVSASDADMSMSDVSDITEITRSAAGTPSSAYVIVTPVEMGPTSSAPDGELFEAGVDASLQSTAREKAYHRQTWALTAALRYTKYGRAHEQHDAPARDGETWRLLSRYEPFGPSPLSPPASEQDMDADPKRTTWLARFSAAFHDAVERGGAQLRPVDRAGRAEPDAALAWGQTTGASMIGSGMALASRPVVAQRRSI
ncbi:hypothetical protein Q5752_001332 [Cryptotrichosporon argae]